MVFLELGFFDEDAHGIFSEAAFMLS